MQKINKVAAITASFWVMKILATTLGETSGDFFSMTLNLGYVVSLSITTVFFLFVLMLQLKSHKFHPVIYWAVIVGTTTVGTEISDLMDRTLGLGYFKGSFILFSLLSISLAVWYYKEKNLEVYPIYDKHKEMFYWMTVLFSNSLGTAFGDFLSDNMRLSYVGGALVCAAIIILVIFFHYFSRINQIVLFWIAFVFTRPFGATFGDLLTKPIAKGGLNLGTVHASIVTALLLGMILIYSTWSLKNKTKDGVMITILVAFMLMGLTNPASAQSTNASLQSTTVSIPDGKDGIHFDDINYSTGLHKLLVPAGHTGKLYLIDPVTYVIMSISGFSSSAKEEKGVDVGISSADEGEGFIFVADHGTQKLDAVDVKSGTIVASAPLANDVDFVRYVDSSHEVWATEPDGKDKKIIEVFKFTAADKPSLYHSLDINFTKGPESLTIDSVHHLAYTNLGQKAAAIDLRSHTVVAQWPNGCEKSRGTAVDGQRGFLFVGCGEGKAVVLNINQDGKQLSSLATGAGVDLIDYNPRLSHLYITSGKSATLSVLGVSPKGDLSLLAVGQAVNRAHCVTGDDQNNIWVCAPKQGQLLRYKDTFAAVQ